MQFNPNYLITMTAHIAERREGTEGSRQNQKRERNERVAWTAVVGVCFIDRTSHGEGNMSSSR
jgi:hypothetical protein